MAIQITKTKEKEIPALPKVDTEPEPTAMADEELADLYGSLQDQCEAIMTNPVFARFELAKKELLARVAAAVEPQDGAEISGHEWSLEIGACSRKPRAVVDVPSIAKFMGISEFAKIAKVTIADIEKHLTPTQVAAVISDDTGYNAARKITAKYLGNKA